MRKVNVAVTQMACSRERTDNIEKAENIVREASNRGANIILLQELFETQYFFVLTRPKQVSAAGLGAS